MPLLSWQSIWRVITHFGEDRALSRAGSFLVARRLVARPLATTELHMLLFPATAFVLGIASQSPSADRRFARQLARSGQYEMGDAR